MDEEGGRPDVHMITYIERQVRVRAPIVDIKNKNNNNNNGNTEEQRE